MTATRPELGAPRRVNSSQKPYHCYICHCYIPRGSGCWKFAAIDDNRYRKDQFIHGRLCDECHARQFAPTPEAPR